LTLESDEKTSKESKQRFFYVWEVLHKWLFKSKEVMKAAYGIRK